MDTTGIEGSADGMYYTAAANWAVREGIITGFKRPDDTFDFAADVPVSFEQMMTIIARTYASINDPAAEGDLSAFVDGDEASEWSFRALAWAHGRGLVTGYDEPDSKYLRPGESVKRERAAMVLMRAFQLGIIGVGCAPRGGIDLLGSQRSGRERRAHSARPAQHRRPLLISQEKTLPKEGLSNCESKKSRVT